MINILLLKCGLLNICGRSRRITVVKKLLFASHSFLLFYYVSFLRGVSFHHFLTQHRKGVFGSMRLCLLLLLCFGHPATVASSSILYLREPILLCFPFMTMIRYAYRMDQFGIVPPQMTVFVTVPTLKAKLLIVNGMNPFLIFLV